MENNTKSNKRKKCKIISMVFVVIFLFTYVINFLFSIHFKLEHYLRDFAPIHNFSEHKEEFEIIARNVKEFKDNNIDFFEKYIGRCYFDNERKTLRFVKNTSDKYDYIFEYEFSESNKIGGYYKVFPQEFHYSNIYIDKEYPDYVMFSSDEVVVRRLVYTGGEKPQKMIDEYWKKYNFVRVNRIAYGWYDISCEG